VLHFPDESKEGAFRDALSTKLEREDHNFSGLYFPRDTPEFKGRKFHTEVRFIGATFRGQADFSGAIFYGNSNFSDALFNGEKTLFREALFAGDATFANTRFRGDITDFQGAKFGGHTRFLGTRFEATETSFWGAKFGGNEVSFDGSEFSGDKVWFTEAKFGSKFTTFLNARFDSSSTNFSDTIFHSERTSFALATLGRAPKKDGFGGMIDFAYARFGGMSIAFANAHFSGDSVWFNHAVFSSREGTLFREAQFDGKDTVFSNVLFGSECADFSSAKFTSESTEFTETEFRDATFESATFQHGADFTEAEFAPDNKTDFRRATFAGEVYFREARFNGYTDFYRANFLDAAKFIGDEKKPQVFAPNGQVSFTRARIEKPDLFLFDTVRLRPSWFVGVDARKFDFTAVEWYGLLRNSPEGSLHDEIERVREKEKGRSTYSLLAQACQRLAANAEDNRDYPTANEFHYWSMDALRQGKPVSALAAWRLIWWYWILSGYGERQIRALGWLTAILVGFAALYMWLQPWGAEETPKIGVLNLAWESIVYSLGVMTRLANDIPNNATPLEESLIILEGVLGPFQIALFALALRRRFMR
jgi:uncharacterized protein YjbI with pentapeptide repeats